MLSLFLGCVEQSETKTSTTVVMDGKCSIVEDIVPEVIRFDDVKVKVYDVDNEKWCYIPHGASIASRVAIRLKAQFPGYETVAVSIGSYNRPSLAVFRKK
jgi:hypothetical protein